MYIEIVGLSVHLKIIVYRMEFDKTRWSCPWNSDQSCTQNSAKGWQGLRGWGWGVGGLGVVGGEEV